MGHAYDLHAKNMPPARSDLASRKRAAWFSPVPEPIKNPLRSTAYLDVVGIERHRIGFGDLFHGNRMSVGEARMRSRSSTQSGLTQIVEDLADNITVTGLFEFRRIKDRA